MHKLLIIDDSKDLLEAMAMILSQKGYEVKTIYDSVNIFEEVTAYNPDLVIIDVFLGGKDGREICKDLKNSITNRNLRVMVFSASPKHLEEYSSYGADGYLEKPFGINNLTDKIEHLLSGTAHSITVNS